jgi:hypothetical protein
MGFPSRRASTRQPRGQRPEARELFFDQLIHMRLKLGIRLTKRLSLFSGCFASQIANKNTPKFAWARDKIVPAGAPQPDNCQL